MPSTVPVFDPASPQAAAIRDLFVQVLCISAGIFMIVAGLICVALWRFRARAALPAQNFGSEKEEIAWLVGPVIIVLWILAGTVQLILSFNAAPPLYAAPGATTEHDGVVDLVVTGHQWWWEVEYPGTDIVSANEVHIPTGQKLRVQLHSGDVIHCFWVAQLARKMDAIPGHDELHLARGDAAGRLSRALRGVLRQSARLDELPSRCAHARGVRQVENAARDDTAAAE